MKKLNYLKEKYVFCDLDELARKHKQPEIKAAQNKILHVRIKKYKRLDDVSICNNAHY